MTSGPPPGLPQAPAAPGESVTHPIEIEDLETGGASAQDSERQSNQRSQDRGLGSVGASGVGNDPPLRVVEVFGPTLQGEGPNGGRAAMFVRLAGCHVGCAWCDTAFSWDAARRDPDRPARTRTVTSVAAELADRQSRPSPTGPDWDTNTHCGPASTPADLPAVTAAGPDAGRSTVRDVEDGPVVAHARPKTDIGRFLAATPVRRVVVTGGEPLLQRDGVAALATLLRSCGWDVEIETSGTISPGPLAALGCAFNVSPKLAHSGVEARVRLRPAVLDEFGKLQSAEFKFVVRRLDDLDEIQQLLEDYLPRVPPSRVWVMPEGTDSHHLLAVARTVVDAATSRGWAVTPRLHVLLWGDEPGR